ncbi:hypothetical protein M378DRAFT_10544 [Amanita muscaria Koide BX008]|uniref:K Homology domain-containing protein n=1 Tax=Amanita muscaria (strain Koide BX008) TaxID=946122 RepID=A0A0C2WW07_AMAMK|nr:hypothetical protein M378DRAFT_10544 [Amanita muscaria Koide BX008]
MSLSAAELQKRHQLEGAPDPFPAAPEVSSAKPKPSKPAELDTESEVAFPSLAPSAPAIAPARQVWGASATGPRIKPSVNQTLHTDSFTLPVIDLPAAGKDGRATTVGDVMRQITTKYKVKLDASGNQKTRQTTFYLKAESAKELEKAKRNLLSLLSPVVTVVFQAPASTIPSIIGSKGSTLKQIRDQTNVKIDIPKKETLTPNGNGHPNGYTSGKVTPSQDDEEEPTIPITLTGPQPLVQEAQALINEIIASKTSIITQRVRDIPAHIIPFVRARRAAFIAAAQGVEVQLGLNEVEREVTVHGDREAVGRVIDTIKATVEGFKEVLDFVKLSISKQKHRLLVGKAADEILAKSKCFAVVPKFDDPAEEITVWGQPIDLPGGLSTVMAQANSKYIHEFPLPPATSKQLLTYMARIHFPKTLMDTNPDVSVYLPPASTIEKGHNLNIVLTGDKPQVESTIREISGMLGKLTGATKEVSIDWLLHRVIMGKNIKKIKQFHDVHNVVVFFPSESSEQSTVLLVYDPQSPSASPSPDDKKKHLEDVEKELLRMEKEAADVDSQVIPVEKRWHEAVLGPNGTTLNAIIGEDKTLSIKVGADAGNSDTDDVILVRGIRSEVSRAVKDILKMVEDAKNDVIVSSHVIEFEVEKEYIGRVVGAQGVSINRLREQLAVKIDVIDETEDKEKEGGKRKKVLHQKSKFRITGRKENAEETRKRILAQVERIADETSEVLKIPNQYHASLIGQNGKYAIRLEEKYGVKITFPRSSSENGEGRTREQLKPDEVLVKGGKKGVANAKSELLDAYEFEKESNIVLKFTIPTRAIARVLGKNGVSINEIKADTATQIDIDKFGEGGDVTTVTVRGTKEANAEAKAAILAIASQVKEEMTTTVIVENKYHRSIIGAGGQGLRDLVIRCGGPADPKQQAGLIRFPRQGEFSDEVKIRGEPEIVVKLQQELENIAASLRDRIVLGVQIPAAQHRALIGRGGQHLNELQSKSGAQVQFPGSRSYSQVGEPENAAELADVDAADIVKVMGPREACNTAIELLKSQVRPPYVEVTDAITVPLKYHHAISQQGAFYRKLRSIGVQVEQSVQPAQPAVPAKPLNTPSGRIDDTEAIADTEPPWEVIPNYQESEEGDSTWTLKARDQESLERAKGMILDGIQHAEGMSHVGFLTMPDRAVFPRIVGAKGATVARLREDTGADITVSREDTTIVIIGSESSIETAREAILEIFRSQRRK